MTEESQISNRSSKDKESKERKDSKAGSKTSI